MANQFGSNVTGENVSGDGNTYGESIVGVQLDAPMQSGFEQGFNPTGEDMSGLEQRGTDPTGVQLPYGNSASEAGWNSGEDMSGMASLDGFPDFRSMGAESDMSMGNGPQGANEIASSAGFHMVTSFDQMFGGYSGTTPAPQGEQDIR